MMLLELGGAVYAASHRPPGLICRDVEVNWAPRTAHGLLPRQGQDTGHAGGGYTESVFHDAPEDLEVVEGAVGTQG